MTPYSWEVAIKHDWSPNGKLILLTTNADFVIPGASANLVTIKPNGTGKTDLTKFTGGWKNAFAGSFSPDGKQVVFRLEEGDTYSLAVMDLADSSRHEAQDWLGQAALHRLGHAPIGRRRGRPQDAR